MYNKEFIDISSYTYDIPSQEAARRRGAEWRCVPLPTPYRSATAPTSLASEGTSRLGITRSGMWVKRIAVHWARTRTRINTFSLLNIGKRAQCLSTMATEQRKCADYMPLNFYLLK